MAHKFVRMSLENKLRYEYSRTFSARFDDTNLNIYNLR